MKDLAKIIGVNLGILVAYSLPLRLAPGQGGIMVMMLSAFLIFCHFLANIMAGISVRSIAEKKDQSGSYILSAFLVLIIGFGICAGNARIF